MVKIETAYFENFRKEIFFHEFISGEIILNLYDHGQSKYDARFLINALFEAENIKFEGTDYVFKKVTKEELITSIKYGLSTKLNYTDIRVEFDKKAQSRFSHEFLRMFDAPNCYTFKTRLYQLDLDLEDFWKTGGGIAMDNKKIGIFLINDLYKKGKNVSKNFKI